MPRKISGKELAADIRGGAHDTELMAKYEISPSELAKLKDKLEAAGLLPKVADSPKPSDSPPLPMVCPDCGRPFPPGAVKCPACTRQAARSPSRAVAPPSGAPAPPGSDLPLLSPPIPDYGRRKALILTAVIAIGLIAFTGFTVRKRDEARLLAELRPTLHQLNTEDPLQVDWKAVQATLTEAKARHKGLLGGWGGSYEDLLQACVEMVPANEAMLKQVEEELKKKEEIRTQEEAVQRKIAKGENEPADLQVMRGMRHRAEASARLEGPLIRLNPVKGRHDRLIREIRGICRNKLSAP
jgi:hypothetical protein